MKKALLIAAVIGFTGIAFGADTDTSIESSNAPSKTEVVLEDDRTVASQVWNDELKQPVQQIGSVVAEQTKEIVQAVKESNEVKGLKNFNQKRKKWF